VLIVVSTYAKRMLPDVQQQMWVVYRQTGDLSAAAAVIGVDRTTVKSCVGQQGGLRPGRSVAGF
jgi:hypothetical protein